MPWRLLLPEVLSNEEVWDKRIYREWPQISISLNRGHHLLFCLLTNCIFLEASDSILRWTSPGSFTSPIAK